jgi:outer membrane immunogenic protein
MQKALGSATLVALLALGGGASAAEISSPATTKEAPVSPAPGWAGFYSGANAGWGWGANNPDFSGSIARDFENPNTRSGQGSRLDVHGGFLGDQIGYNWQSVTCCGYKDGAVLSRYVYGIEADFQRADVNDTDAHLFTVLNPDGGTGTVFAKSALDWFGTVRGRIGYTFDSTLVYATGGFAFGQVRDKLYVSAITAAGVRATRDVIRDDTDTGFSAGAGVEYLITPSWSVKAEYQFIDLGSDRLTALADNHTDHALGSVNFDHTYNTFRIGVNYHFRPCCEPLK